MAERGRGIGRRARRSPARPGGRGLRAARRDRRGRGDAGTRRERGGPREARGGHGRTEGGRALRGRGRGGGGKQRRVCARLRGNLGIRARGAFELAARCEVLRGQGMPQCVLGVACAGKRGRPWCGAGPARSAALAVGPPPGAAQVRRQSPARARLRPVRPYI